MKTKLFSILALLLMAVSGAWAQTYNVTLAEGTEDADNWAISPNPAEEGQAITITYSGTKKVKSIKAVKKAAPATARALAEATAEDLGKIAGADGNIYDSKDAASTAGTTAVAMIAYVGSSTDHATYTHGLAIALADESNYSNWFTAKSTCEGKSAVTNAAWQLPSRNQWNAMFGANGGDNTKYTGLNNALATAGGTAMQVWGEYWSSTTNDEDEAWDVLLDVHDEGYAYCHWYLSDLNDKLRVRPVLAF